MSLEQPEAGERFLQPTRNTLLYLHLTFLYDNYKNEKWRDGAVATVQPRLATSNMVVAEEGLAGWHEQSPFLV